MLLKKRNILKEELLLQGLGASRDNYTFSAANGGQQISQGLSRSSTGLNDEMLALLNCLLHGLRHLKLAPAKLIVGVRLAQQPVRSKKLVESGERGTSVTRGSFGIGRERHGGSSFDSISLSKCTLVNIRSIICRERYQCAPLCWPLLAGPMLASPRFLTGWWARGGPLSATNPALPVIAFTAKQPGMAAGRGSWIPAES